MKTSELIWNVLRDNRLIALLAPESGEQCVQAWEVLHPLGVVLEIALRTPAALAGMAALRAKHPDALFLAGTVVTGSDAEKAIEAGAAGIVSPDYFPHIVELCVRRDVMCVPGGLNDAGKQLAQKAELYKCTLEELHRRHPYQWVYKCFPAMAGAPANLEGARAWKSVYNNLTIIYTGGVTVDNAYEIVKSDPDAIVCGSALTRHMSDAELLRRDARRWLAIIHPARVAVTSRSRPVARSRPTGEPPTIVTFGEIMLRLAPPHGVRFGQASTLDMTFGGAEANVAVALAIWGAHARFVSAVPEHAVGDAAVDALRSHGVDTSGILRFGARLGLYYLEPGASQRPSQVIYDRAGSSMAAIKPGQIDWDAILDGVDWFHVTGITPALSTCAAEATAEAIGAARGQEVAVSLDLNYRARLWPSDLARRVLTPMLGDVDLLISNEADATELFDIGSGALNDESGELNIEACADMARQLAKQFDLPRVAMTLRESASASDNAFSACLVDGDDLYWSKRYSIHLVDRVGGGDAFAAGLIWALLSGRIAPDALEFAVAASCLKQTVRGDFSLATVAEVESLAGGKTSGRIKR